MPTTARENARPINTKYASDSALQRQSRHATPAHRGTPSHDSLRCCAPRSTHTHCAPPPRQTYRYAVNKKLTAKYEKPPKNSDRPEN